MRVLGISTSSNTGTDHESWGASASILLAALHHLRERGCEVKCINAAELHIVGNLSCYASGKYGCGDPEAGPYRCWAHWNSLQDPDKYGGVDEMPVIYDGIKWADLVLVATSNRWGSHTAILQTIIERLNTLESRHTVWDEGNPFEGKRVGVITTGLHWLTQRVAAQTLETFGLMGFEAGFFSVFTWQRLDDMRLEQEGPNRPLVEIYLESEKGKEQMRTFLEEAMGARAVSKVG